jgi:hypothetical protein
MTGGSCGSESGDWSSVRIRTILGRRSGRGGEEGTNAATSSTTSAKTADATVLRSERRPIYRGFRSFQMFSPGHRRAHPISA